VDKGAKDDCNKEACHSSEKNLCPVDATVQEVIQCCAWKYNMQLDGINIQEIKRLPMPIIHQILRGHMIINSRVNSVFGVATDFFGDNLQK
jgi:hypothetical protein